MSALTDILEKFRTASKSEREKGNYFENLVRVYLRQEPYFSDRYAGKVWLWADWRKEWQKRGNADPGPDTGIDLVAETTDGELEAIQAKFYDADVKLTMESFGTFFMASGKKHFARRLIVHTTTDSTNHLKTSLADQHPPVNLISLYDLENSRIDWSAYQPGAEAVALQPGKELREYQHKAISNVLNGLEHADRGKLIMACGTGKTFTSLRLAEKVAGAGKSVLFLVPSLNLLSQTLTDWTQEAEIPLHCFAVCSDSEIGKKAKNTSDDYEMLAHELQYPATTDAKMLAQAFAKGRDSAHQRVVFSTYHSIEVISRAQKEFGLPEFDLILCDEAHRTTGATFADTDDSAFVKIHDQGFLQGKKRVYMTATPRVYGTPAKAKAENDSIVLYSMDDESVYGKNLHTLSFSEAVNDLKILCDYKVIVLTVNEAHISARLQRLLADESNSINVNDASKIVGCWRALSKMDSQDDLSFDPEPMKRAVAFAQVIEVQKGGKTHKVSSKNIAGMFAQVVNEYRAELLKENPENPDLISRLQCEADHVDGGMDASQKNQKLEWLKAEAPEETCRILSNVRCLSEGVDVPALDAVLFLTPRNSQVDVVQSVGRVMRKSKDGKKKLGYVILPVVIPADKSPDEALNDNQTYRVVWEVLQALRSHDDRFDAMVNRMQFDGQDRGKMEIISVTDKISAPRKESSTERKAKSQDGKKTNVLGNKVPETVAETQGNIEFEIGDIERAILAKVVQKCGNRLYWDEWAKDIAQIASTHITRLKTILANPANTGEITAFNGFLSDLHADLNDSISRDEAIEMLAQHIITRPVFDALFEGYSFADNNPVSKAMQGVLTVLEKHHLEKESDTLTRMYDSVKRRASDTKTVAGKQKLVLELYDKFFRNAFPQMAERLGIVYTPVEVVDFIIHSVNDVLKSEFGQTLGSPNVHIIDPFTGTGTFITRLMQSGLIGPDELEYKYTHEIHANELVLLAYYIATINIEQVFHSLTKREYLPFSGICLTDTFNLPTGVEDWHDEPTRDNSIRLKRQRELDIRVIIGNPPYSSGQDNANDNNQNLAYQALDRRVEETYALNSVATNKNGLYDTYIRAIRWASDRIGNSGVIGFVSNAKWVDGNATDGLRKCLAQEFSDIYVFHLRGNARTAGELRKQERDSVFGQGTRAPVAISILVKNPLSASKGNIRFHDIGDYLTREQKLDRIADYRSVAGIASADAWQTITPDEHNDWLRQREAGFINYMPIGDKKSGRSVIFETYSRGLETGRDAWCFNSSHKIVATNIKNTIEFYNTETRRVNLQQDSNRNYRNIDGLISRDETKISWTRSLKQDLVRNKELTFDSYCIQMTIYRPFFRQWAYCNRDLNHTIGQTPQMFRSTGQQNLGIVIVAPGARQAFTAMMVNTIPDLHFAPDGAQCFPRFLYEETTKSADRPSGVKPQRNFFQEDDDLFEVAEKVQFTRRDAISDQGLAYFTTAYPGEKITKDDVFFYVYGLLHSAEYISRFADNLAKELPHIPPVTQFADFQAFSKAGRALSDLHIGYDNVAPFPATLKLAKPQDEFTEADYRVTQMKFGKGTGGEKHDKSTVIYNPFITIQDIPLEAYEYVVNGKPALEWVMERQAVTTHKESGIVNDANDWAIETMGNPAYPLELFLRVITVSLETMKIVKALPALDI